MIHHPSFWTAAQSLYLLEPTLQCTTLMPQQWILVHNGMSPVGQCAIQLAHASGYKVVTTAAPAHFGMLKSLGATALVDAHDPAVVSKIKAATGDCVRVGLDTVSVAESQCLSAAAIAPVGGKVVLTQPAVASATMRTDVEFLVPFGVQPALGYAMQCGPLGMHHVMAPHSAEDKMHMAAYWTRMQQICMTGKIAAPVPIMLFEGGGVAAVPHPHLGMAMGMGMGMQCMTYCPAMVERKVMCKL